MKNPYIGITDFMSVTQVNEVLHFLNVGRRPTIVTRSLGVGVMMSRKTLNGLPTKWSTAFPKNADVAKIFIDHPDVYNVLHYADFEPIDVFENLSKAVDLGGDNLQALQLDMCWPDPKDLQRLKDNHPHLDLILQVGRKAFDMVEEDPKKLVAELAKYEVLDSVLLDKSMGEGLEMNPNFFLPFVVEIFDRFREELHVALAGGLGPATIQLVEPIAKEFPLVSIDAQGRLRPSRSALDPIDWEMAYKYLHEALRMFEETEYWYMHMARLGRRPDLIWRRRGDD